MEEGVDNARTAKMEEGVDHENGRGGRYSTRDSTRTENMEEGRGDSVGIMNVGEETGARMGNMKEGVDSVRTDKIVEGGDSVK